MNFSTLFVGALTLKNESFVALRERSDVFLRGFVVLLFAAIVAGLFAALSGALGDISPQLTKDQVIQIANQSFESSYNGPPEMKAQFQAYPGEIASMIYELETLPPRAGQVARPIAAIINYVGNVLVTPFSWMWAGWMLFAGLLFQFSARLLGGRASINQMLGLTALAAAPQIFSSLTSLLNLLAARADVTALGSLASLLSFIIAIWSAAIYIKATSVAQNFSLARSVGAIALGYGILILVVIVGVLVFGVVVGGVIGTVARGG